MPRPILAGLALLAAGLLGCGGSTAPKQARFEVAGCDPLDLAFPGPADWRPAPDPILEPGPPGAWDAIDVLNPSLVEFQDQDWLLYSGFDGETWRTGVATRQAGGWIKHAANPLIEPDPATWEAGYIAANGTTLAAGGELWHLYQAGPRNQTALGLARSGDGLAWRKHPEPVFTAGPRGGWDEAAVGDPYLLRCGSTLYLYYLGQDRFGVQRLGLARSPDGIHWQRSHRNPILETGGTGDFDERGLGEPAVFRAADGFWMLYVGRDAEERRRLGWAFSPDGLHWEKRGPILSGDLPWNRAVVCDPEIMVSESGLRILFGGGENPSPDENLAGRIGVADLVRADSR